MIPEFVYVLCALASGLCTALLTRGYRRTHERLLLWSSWCFAVLTAANVLLVVDLTIFQATVDLSVPRTALTLAGVAVMLFGLIWESR